MPVRRRTFSNEGDSTRPPANSPEEREHQLISAAVDLAEKQLREGTASAQVISHFLKLGSSREVLEQERIKNEVALLETKREVMESEKRTEALIVDALEAMKRYSGNSPDEQEPEYDEYLD